MRDGTGRARVIAAFAVGGGALGAGAALYWSAWRPVTEAAAPAAEASTTEGPDDALADWCAPGFEPIRGGACLASAGVKSTAALIVYLHGRYPRDAASDEIDRQRRLGGRATALGFAVVAMRGRLGTCTAPELATWYCWPSNENNADAGPEFVDGWTAGLAAAQERTAARHRFLLGFSNGGYFAGLVASRGLLGFDAFAIAHGGPVEPVRALRGTPPLLLLSADDDVAQDDMIRYDEELTREHWAHDSYARAGVHGLTDLDIDAALTFFSRAREPLPLQPPLSLHRAVRHVRDASTEAPIAADEAEGGTPPINPGSVTGQAEQANEGRAEQEDASSAPAGADVPREQSPDP